MACRLTQSGVSSKCTSSPLRTRAVVCRATGSSGLSSARRQTRVEGSSSRATPRHHARQQQKKSVRSGSALTSSASTETVMVKRMQNEDAQKLLDSTKMFIFDCDGVIWRGDEVIEGVPETLDMLREMGKQLVFVTNNSTKSRAGYLKKFTGLGLNVKAEEIFSSSFAAAAYLSFNDFKGTAYVIGEIGIEEELDMAGIKHIGGPSDAGKIIDLSPGQKMEHDPDVSAVIVGFDRNVNYYKIQYATLCIRENEGCQFIATNTDAVTHLTSAQEWAGNGSMVGAIKGSTQREPTVVGKPAPFMLDYMTDKFGVNRDEICMVGDRLDTDILFGKDGGLKTLLVLSGVTPEATLLSEMNTIHPDMYTSKLPDVCEAIKANSL